jgi:hypothetical protein
VVSQSALQASCSSYKHWQGRAGNSWQHYQPVQKRIPSCWGALLPLLLLERRRLLLLLMMVWGRANSSWPHYRLSSQTILSCWKALPLLLPIYSKTWILERQRLRQLQQKLLQVVVLCTMLLLCMLLSRERVE